MTDKATARAQLLARRAELEALSEMAREAREVVQLDQQSVGRLSRMDAMQARAMALANERQRAAELGRIAAALHRLDAGSYGECLDCGEEIAPRRLAVDPAATLCIACAGRN
jgi:DnaK suppressor protein